MSVLLPRQRRGQVKPYASLPRIDWSHPLAQGLTIYVYDLGTAYVDLVNGGGLNKVGTGTTPLTGSMSKYGRGLLYGSGANSNWAYMPLTRAAGITGAALPYSTFFATIYTGAPAASFTTVAATGSSADNGDTGVAWLAGSTTQMSYFWDNGGSSANYNQLLSTTSQFQTWGMVPTSSTAAILYANGAVDHTQGSISSTTFAISTGSARVCFNCLATNGNLTTGAANAFIPFFAYWNRYLTAYEAWLLHNDPWCFLIYPEEEDVAVGTVVAAALPPGAQLYDLSPRAADPFAQWRAWADSYKQTLLGKDKFNPGQQWDKTPDAWSAPERFAQWRAWADSYKLTLIGKDSVPPGVQTNYLPSGITWDPGARTWTDSFKLTLTGKDQFPPGVQTNYLPLGIIWRPDLLTWADSYKLTLIGKDSFPPGTQTNYPPDGWLAPERFAQWRTWTDQYKLTLIGNDSFPPGKQTNYLPFGITWRPDLLTWIDSYKLTLIGKDALPPGNKSSATPDAWFATERFAQWRTWTDSYKLTLVGKDGIPPGDQTNYLPSGVAWRPESPPPNLTNTLLAVIAPSLPPGTQINYLPIGAVWRPESPQQNLSISTLTGQDKLPSGSQFYDISLRSADPFAQWRGWTGSYNLNLVGRDAFPPGSKLFDLPSLGSRQGVDFAAPNLLSTLLALGLPPGSQFYESPPRTDPFAQWRNWTGSYNLNLIGLDALPSGQQLFSLPSFPQRGSEFAASNLLSTLLAPQGLPPGAQVYDLAPRTADPFAQWRSWGQGFNLNLIGQDRLPSGMQWNELPKAVQIGTSFVPTINLSLLYPPILLPPGSQFYDLSPRIADSFAQWRSWSQGYNLNLSGKDQFPPGSQWNELPKAIQVGTTVVPTINVALLYPPISIPPGAQVYDLPPRSGELFAQWRSWSSFNNNLIGQDRFPSGAQLFTLPPLGPQRGLDFAGLNLLSTLLAPQGLPPGTQFYDLSPRTADPFAQWRSWASSYNLSLIGKDALPIGAQSYELPPRVSDSFAQWRNWSGSYNVNLIAKDALPVGGQRHELPPQLIQIGTTFVPTINLSLLLTPAPPPVISTTPAGTNTYIEWRWLAANLPPATLPGLQRAFVTDSVQTIAAGIGSPPIGGGTHVVPVYVNENFVWVIG
jgi:hypothetical protein